MKLRALAVAATLLLVPTSVAFAHTPLKSMTPKKNSTQHKAVKEVRATFKAKMQTGIIEITKVGEQGHAQVERPDQRQQGGHPSGPEQPARLRHLQGQLARPRR